MTRTHSQTRQELQVFGIHSVLRTSVRDHMDFVYNFVQAAIKTDFDIGNVTVLLFLL